MSSKIKKEASVWVPAVPRNHKLKHAWKQPCFLYLKKKQKKTRK